MKILSFVNPNAKFLIDAMLPEGWTSVIVSSETDGKAYAEKAISEAPDADFFLVGLEPITKEIIKPAKKLKLIQRLGAGFDNVDLPAAKAHGVPVANIPGANSVAVAEHTIMVIIALYKRLTESDATMKQGQWKMSELLLKGCFELWKKTVGIIGLGRIGKEVARRLKGFDVTTLYSDILTFPPELEKELNVRRASLDEILTESDVITVHVPLTKLTNGMIGARQFGMMKSTALFIQSSRGEVVDEAALAEALDRGIIGAAAVDVFKEEPLNADSPLLKAENIILTPHTAGVTREVSMRFLTESFDNFKRVASGQPPLYVLDEV
ncbi:lactate dehydrogenase [Candidatus Poribacteria bacterium]|nr:lactate dehydrogenase [Candidatus Poribacteria bacterium]